MKIDGTHARRDTVEFRIVPGDWKRDRRVEQDAEVVRAMGVFPKIIRINNEPAPDPLLQTAIELISPARLDRRRLGTKNIGCQAAASSSAGKNQIFIEWSLERARIGGSQNCIRR